MERERYISELRVLKQLPFTAPLWHEYMQQRHWESTIRWAVASEILFSSPLDVWVARFFQVYSHRYWTIQRGSANYQWKSLSEITMLIEYLILCCKNIHTFYITLRAVHEMEVNNFLAELLQDFLNLAHHWLGMVKIAYERKINLIK